MQYLTYDAAPAKREKTESSGNQKRERYAGSIILAFGGGLFFILGGFFLQIIYTFFDRSETALNYAGVGSLVTALIFFAVGAHFMDKSDDDQRRARKSEKPAGNDPRPRPRKSARKISTLSGI